MALARVAGIGAARLDVCVIEALDQRDFIAAIVVAKFIHEASGEHDPEAAFAETEFITQLDMADRVFVARGMRQVSGIETRPLVLDDQRDRFRIDAIGNPQDQISVLAVTPLDGISSHFHHGLFQVLDLAVGERGMGEQVGEHVMGLLKVCQLAANIEIDLAVGAPLQVLVVPEDRFVDDLVELSGREWLGQVTVGPDPHTRGPMIRILEGAVTITMGIRLVSRFRFNWSQIAKPSTSGSIRSSKTSSGFFTETDGTCRLTE